MELKEITVSTSSRTPAGSGGFQEAGVCLSFAVTGEPLDKAVAEANSALLRAYQALWSRLDGPPDPQ